MSEKGGLPMGFAFGPREGAGLLVKEFDLTVDAPAVTAQLAAGADDAMAGDEIHHRIAADSPTHRPCRLRQSDTAGDDQIGGDHTGWDVQQILPDSQLESGAPQVQIQSPGFFGFPLQQPNSFPMQLHLPTPEICVREMPFQLFDRFPAHLAGHKVADTLGSGGNQVTMGGYIDQTVVDGQPLLLAGKLAPRHRNYPNGIGIVLFHNNVKLNAKIIKNVILRFFCIFALQL